MFFHFLLSLLSQTILTILLIDSWIVIEGVIEVIEERFLTTKLQEFTTYIIDLMGNGVRYPMKLKD